MTSPLWVIELARTFWNEIGQPEPFPRRLRAAIRDSGFDLTIREMPNLSVGQVERYLTDLGVRRLGCLADRPLQACLVATSGAGFIFLSADDSEAERTFSLAHELAHFLRDYWQPRRRAVAALGEGILEVLDGRRPPRPDERLHSLLRAVPIGLHLHLMRRDAGCPAADVAVVETAADRLAWELLAPETQVRGRSGAPGPAGAGELVATLCEAFGFPEPAARAYAEDLFPAENKAALPPPCDRPGLSREVRLGKV